jgi:hypothetical protein
MDISTTQMRAPFRHQVLYSNVFRVQQNAPISDILTSYVNITFQQIVEVCRALRLRGLHIAEYTSEPICGRKVGSVEEPSEPATSRSVAQSLMYNAVT